jgi:hypothetical protein
MFCSFIFKVSKAEIAMNPDYSEEEVLSPIAKFPNCFSPVNEIKYWGDNLSLNNWMTRLAAEKLDRPSLCKHNVVPPFLYGKALRLDEMDIFRLRMDVLFNDLLTPYIEQVISKNPSYYIRAELITNELKTIDKMLRICRNNRSYLFYGVWSV